MASSIKGKGKKVSAGSWLGRLSGSVSEAKARAERDKAERKEAGESPVSIILDVNDVRGEYDSHRALVTTLGGRVRPITSTDLESFRKNIKTLQKHFKGGIRARQVLDLSLPIDRERARKEIKVSVPTQAHNGTVRFITSAGPDSDVSRHHVTVDFMSYTSAVSAGRASPAQMANWLRKEPLRFDCDCGRHRYWYRYISTIGGFNAGRAENGYPKIRNPKLVGVACKHVLRTMAEIESSGTVLAFLSRMVKKAMESEAGKATIKNSQAEAEASAGKQSARSRAIKTTEDRQRDRDAVRAKKALAETQKTAPKRKSSRPRTRKLSSNDAETRARAAATLAKEFGMSTEQVLALLARHKG